MDRDLTMSVEDMEPPEEPDTPDIPDEEPAYPDVQISTERGFSDVIFDVRGRADVHLYFDYGRIYAGFTDGPRVAIQLDPEQMRDLVRNYFDRQSGMPMVEFQRELLASSVFYHRRREMIATEVGRVLHQRQKRHSSDTPRLRYSDSTAYPCGDGKYGYVYSGRVIRPGTGVNVETVEGYKYVPAEMVFVEGYGSTSDAARYDALLKAREINPACEPDEGYTGEER